jgi:Phage integrase family
VDKYGNRVTRFGFHNFRHSLATFLIEKGHDPLVVQRMLRHSHVDMTMHYTRNSHMRREAQADFIERFLPEGERVPVRVLVNARDTGCSACRAHPFTTARPPSNPASIFCRPA